MIAAETYPRHPRLAHRPTIEENGMAECRHMKVGKVVYARRNRAGQ